ncbi:hypothetical protein ACFOSD_11720 [Salinispirillum marinum]|uniref:Uncharacterized protein n=2 Tax=Saccharospirillaceae TaxID=255527 RepID=A0ABV8BHQ4_9GAMM
MAETHKEKVERFINFNRDRINSAFSDFNLNEQSVNAKILLCSIIDSLAKSRFPKISSNGERFKRTIQTSAKWNDCERISLLHLKRALQVSHNDNRDFKSLSDWVDSTVNICFNIDNKTLSTEIAISNDPEPKNVLKLWPHDKNNSPIKLGSIHWNQLTHKNLFWLYRNSLMHEYRIPGRAIELNVTKVEPFYQKVYQIEDYCPDEGVSFTHRWELLYPSGFFRVVAENILEDVAKYHKTEGTSPFKDYSDGTFWIPNFND